MKNKKCNINIFFNPFKKVRNNTNCNSIDNNYFRNRIKKVFMPNNYYNFYNTRKIRINPIYGIPNENRAINSRYDNNTINFNNISEIKYKNEQDISDSSEIKQEKHINEKYKKGKRFDKYKKIPDYKGDDIEEQKVFKYRSVITNPKYNYTNIGSFNEKFNIDLSELSTFYGKESSKGRFVRNPLISMFSKYIPNYEKYKDLKCIENRYISRNRYKFRLKPLVSCPKNNFDKLANFVFKREHKKDTFSNS